MSYDNYDRLLESEYVSDYDDDDRRFGQQPVRGCFVHSDQDFFTVQHRGGGVGGGGSVVGSSACSVADRPVSSPAFYPDLDWYLPPPDAIRRSGEETEEDAKTRIDAWISRLDRLISDRPTNNEMTSSSQATLTSSGSSSGSTEVADEEEGVSFPRRPCPEEVRRPTDQRREYLLVGPGPPSVTVHTGAGIGARLPVGYQTGTVCSNIDEAYEILNTRYKLEDIAVERKPIITWSKWNVSQVVRGPHEQSPIWNSSLQKIRYDRPNSIVFRELDKEIDRRNKELEQIVEKKTELCRRFCSSQNSPSPPPSTSPTSSSPPVSPQTPPVASCSSASPYFLSSSSSSSSSPSSPPPSSSCRLPHPVPEPSSQTLSPDHRILLHGHGSSLESQPASSHPPVAMTTTKEEEEEEEEKGASRDPPPAAEAAAAGQGVGFGLIRRMVKSFWSIFSGGDGSGCHGDAKNSREVLKGDEKPEKG